MEAFAITPEKKELFQKLFDELKYALKDLSSQELKEILIESSTIAVKDTYNSKKNSIKNTYIFLKKNIDRYKKDGVAESFKHDMDSIQKFLVNLPEKIKVIYNNFLSLDREKQIEIVAITIISVAIFFAASGGLDFEGGLPDTDIALMGIGDHRNVVSHSILIGLGIEFTGRFGILTLGKIRNRLPLNHHVIWDKVYLFLDNNKNIAISAMWLGIGTHLLKDTGIISGGIKPYTGLPVEMSMEGHQGLFAANGIASMMFGTNIKS